MLGEMSFHYFIIFLFYIARTIFKKNSVIRRDTIKNLSKCHMSTGHFQYDSTLASRE
jgi:hypothetical protein